MSIILFIKVSFFAFSSHNKFDLLINGIERYIFAQVPTMEVLMGDVSFSPPYRVMRNYNRENDL